jgi:nitroreductase
LDIFKVFRKRKSVRSYLPTPVLEKDLLRVLDAARLAPSAGNVQPWHFIIIRDREKREKIARGCRYGKFLSESPVVIVACGDKQASSQWFAIDTSIALQQIVLAATALGLGTCWIGMFNENEICSMIKLPKKYEIIALISLGYPREKRDLWSKILHTFRPRKQLAEILSSESYGNDGVLIGEK